MPSNFINVDNFGYALLTKDDSTGVTYGAVKSIPGSMKISVQPNSQRSPFYSDGVLQEYGQVLGEVKVSIDLSTVPLSVQADFLGHTVTNGQLVCKATDVAPYIAFFYRRKKANGKYRHVKILKALFGESKDDAEQSEGKVKFQNDSFDGVAMPRQYDDTWRKFVDEEETGFTTLPADWYTSMEGSPDVTPPTIASTVPVANATGVVVSSTYIWTMSEQLNPATVSTASFYLIKDTDGSIVPGTVVYNDSAKTVTFTPTSNLSAATKYLALADASVTDLAGNHLAPVARFFTTA